MAKTWLSIRVDLVHGRGEDFWPRPGRILTAARSHTFQQLADAINLAFGRWDFSHLSEFVVGDGTRISHADPLYDAPEDTVEIRTAKLSQLRLGDQLAYTFDFGDRWQHLCTVGPERVDPYEVYGTQPHRPVPYWGWGPLPDQYGRRWAEDDLESPVPPDPQGSDLPPILPEWRWRQEHRR
ncbi:MAG: hypothetical protein AMXMBFR46_28260 [Acidimicrobiia bacterium]